MLVLHAGWCQEISASSSQVKSTKSSSRHLKSHLRCKVLMYPEWSSGVFIEVMMAHLNATRVLEKTSRNLLLSLLMSNSKAWLSLSLETESQTWHWTKSWKTETNSRMESRMKCKKSSPDGVSGLRLVKYKMWQLLLRACSPTCRQSSERRVEWKQKRFPLRLKTKSTLKLL